MALPTSKSKPLFKTAALVSAYSGWLIAASAIGLGLSLQGCAVNPATGSIDTVLMSKSREKEIGKENYEKIIKSMPIYKDEQLQKYIEEIGQQVAAKSDSPEYEYVFTIIDSPDINAFALPAGYIFINRGLLAYLNSEAQLAAVLAHEIGHVTARHAVRQDAARKGAGVLSFLSVLTTGSMAMGDVTSLWSTAAVKGYGRDMELEADQFGAEYLYRTGYDPQAMVQAIGVLKDHEKFSRYRAKDAGQKPRSYHGVFASHPRNDVRLKEVVAKAGTYEPSEQSNYNKQNVRFRKAMEGLVFGNNYAAMMTQAKQAADAKKKDENRYIHNKLGFTLVFPKEWEVENQRKAIVGAPQNESAEIKIEVKNLAQPIPPGQFIRNYFSTDLLAQSEDFSQYGLMGHKGIIHNKSLPKPQRVAVLYQGRRAYILTGSVFKPADNVNYDELFLSSIHSFRPAMGARKPPKANTIHYVKANDKTTFAALAKQIRLGRYTEQQLRLINGYYPLGEPKPGEWIKIIK
ncbi:M48 family metalloprotease [Flocculibacter collagenilyticus]|uniref:M48 family metalloprotease n=1 Tax=Flocculibacter collagenilyticus TaxID=2744479 RepID=UPI0018F731C8|nr:M48 family metalloprotease [Flocculibacter collagenilyticus]